MLYLDDVYTQRLRTKRNCAASVKSAPLHVRILRPRPFSTRSSSGYGDGDYSCLITYRRYSSVVHYGALLCTFALGGVLGVETGGYGMHMTRGVWSVVERGCTLGFLGCVMQYRFSSQGLGLDRNINQLNDQMKPLLGHTIIPTLRECESIPSPSSLASAAKTDISQLALQTTLEFNRQSYSLGIWKPAESYSCAFKL